MQLFALWKFQIRFAIFRLILKMWNSESETFSSDSSRLITLISSDLSAALQTNENDIYESNICCQLDTCKDSGSPRKVLASYFQTTGSLWGNACVRDVPLRNVTKCLKSLKSAAPEPQQERLCNADSWCAKVVKTCAGCSLSLSCFLSYQPLQTQRTSCMFLFP